MPKLKCDKPECENFDKELDEVDVIVSATAPFNEKEDVYTIPTINTRDYYLVCPKCQTVLEEP